MGKRAISLGLAVLLVSAWPASAQYFGRNKVQSEDFDFQVLTTPHFDIHWDGRVPDHWPRGCEHRDVDLHLADGIDGHGMSPFLHWRSQGLAEKRAFLRRNAFPITDTELSVGSRL